MKKLFFFMAFAVAAIALPFEAEAVGRQCPGGPSSININGDATGSAALHTCTTDAIGMQYTFKAMGACQGFPDYLNGLQNCFTVFNEDVEVDLLTTNNATTTQGFMPPAGTYDYFFAVTGNEFQMRCELTFNRDYLSYNGLNGASFNLGEGEFCRPEGSYKTSVISTVDPSNPITSLQSLSGGLPMICNDTASQAGTLTVEIDNVGLTSYSSTLNIDNYDWVSGVDQDVDVNVVLLDAQAGVAANADAVQDVLFIKKAPSNLVIDAETNFSVSFNKDDALQLYYFCDSSLAETINGLAPGTVSDNGSDCIMLGATLGEEAFTPNITISN